MKVLVKVIGSIIGAILYPLFWLLEWVIALVALIVKTSENLMEDDNGCHINYSLFIRNEI